MGFFDKLKNSLTKTRESISDQVNNVFKVFVKVDEDFFEELEDALILSDMGVETTEYIIEELRDRVKSKRLTEADDVREELKNTISEILTKQDSKMNIDKKPAVVLVIGVNGVGKTTSIGKLANYYKTKGNKYEIRSKY